MKIGIYDPYLDDLGGGEKYMLTIAECLAKQHEVSVFWDNEADFHALKDRFSLGLDNIRLTKNIFTPEFGLFKRLMVTRNYDCIIFLSDGSIPLVLSKKLFLHVQQPLDMFENSSGFSKLKYSKITKLFTNSKYTSTFNEKKIHGIKTAILYPPVQLYTKDVPKENIILHVGRFRVKNVGVDDYKKQGVMINAFKKMIDQKLKGWKFVVAASVKKEDEETFAQLQESAAGYPIEFLINKTNMELWESYNKAKIYWHASGFGEDLEKHPEYAEHFGISTVEAMGAGAVPVVINAGGQKEIVTDGANGYLWDTIDELIKKTNQLIDDKKQLEKMSQTAKERAKDFSREKFCNEVYELIGQ